MSIVTNLNRVYSTLGAEPFVLDLPKWEILESGFTVLWGDSGSGKSSLLNILMGFDQKATYQWHRDGIDISKLSPGDRRLGVVYQTAELFFHMTGLENILFASDARAISRDETMSHIQKLAPSLAIESALAKRASDLSGGERQRVALLRAIVGKPRLLFLDEPFAALDARLKNEARRVVRETLMRENIPAVLVTHDRDDFAQMSGKLSEIKAGRIVSETSLSF
jgi:ABC-type sugar transport system ATPase subunit